MNREVDTDRLAILEPGLLFGEPDRADGRVAEHDGRNARRKVPVFHTAVEAVAEAPSGGYGDRRQRRAAGHVAQCVDVLDVGAPGTRPSRCSR